MEDPPEKLIATLEHLERAVQAGIPIALAGAPPAALGRRPPTQMTEAEYHRRIDALGRESARQRALGFQAIVARLENAARMMGQPTVEEEEMEVDPPRVEQAAAPQPERRGRKVTQPKKREVSPNLMDRPAGPSGIQTFLASVRSRISAEAAKYSGTPQQRRAVKRTAEEDESPPAKKGRVESKSEEKRELRRSARIAQRRHLQQVEVKETRKVVRFSAAQQAILTRAFDLTPYLDQTTKVQVAEETELTQLQVKTWFGNRRYKLRQQEKAAAQKPSRGASRIGIKARQSRTIYTEVQLMILEEAFSNNPFPSLGERTELTDSTCLPDNKIKVWFTNRRAKDRRANNKG